MRALLVAAVLVSSGCLGAASVTPPEEDPWGGAGSLVLVDETMTLGTAFSTAPDVCIPFCGGAATTSGERLVPVGTSEIVVLADWNGGPGSIRFVYDTGGSAEAERTLLRRGEPLSISVSPEMTDAPHQRASHWWWGFFAYAEPAGVVEPFEVRANVTAHRASAATTPPPGAGLGVLVDGAVENRGLDTPAAGVCPGCQGTWWSSAPGAIVGADATRVRGEITWSAPGDSPVLGAWVSGLDAFVEFNVVEDAPGRRVFEAAVDPAWRDDASQWKSLWWFFTVNDQPARAFDGSITLLATSE